MPEGPEIRRTADAVSHAIAGRVTTRVWFGQPQLKHFGPQLTGRNIDWVRPRGKALLTRFDNGLTLYTHNQLYGRWHTMPSGDYPESRRQLRLAIDNQMFSALLYSASDIEVLDTSELQRHRYLSRLGPDVLDPETRVSEINSRLLSERFNRRRLGNLLTDQAFVAGLGNYLRCELLFSVGLSPATRPKDCSGASLRTLAEEILRLARQSYQTQGITNDLKRARQLLAGGASFEASRFQVFRRQGLPCYRCGAQIVKEPGSGQPCYRCPQCQR